MAESQSIEDLATLHVLGRLEEAERAEFEARLADSPELRALVRQLENGAEALALAVPQHRPPAEVWQRIERTVAKETRRRTWMEWFWTGLRRSGWAVAGACLIGWLLYAHWITRTHRPVATPAVTVAQSGSPAPAPGAHSAEAAPATKSVADANEALLELLAARSQELDALRQASAELTNRIAHLSRALAHQQALLLETNRLKFVQLVPASGESDATAVPISTNLQRALFLAMAYELGWLQSEGTVGTNLPPLAQFGVDLVDLRNGSNNPANPVPQSQAEQPAPEESEPFELTTAAAAGVPGFISGTNAVLAFDATVAPTGSRLTLWRWSADAGWYQLVGSASLGNNTLVVAAPFSVTAPGGTVLTVVAETPSGASNVIGHLSAPPTEAP